MGVHTFGGRSMDRYLFEFDPEADGGGGDILAGGDVPAAEVGADVVPGAEPGAEATVPEAEVPSPAAAEAPAWAPDPDEWAQLTEGVTALTQIERQRAQEAAAATARAEQPEWNLDPIENENFADDLKQFLAHTIREATEPLTGTVQQVAAKEAEAQVGQLLDGITGVDGYEPEAPMYDGGPTFKDGVRELSAAFIDQVKSEAGMPLDQPGGARVAQEAMRRAAAMLGQMAVAQRKAGEQAYLAGMEGLKDAARVPAASGGGIEGAVEPENEEEAVRRLLARSS